MNDKKEHFRMGVPEFSGPDPRDISICIVCGGTALARKCKIICQNCGYTRDCSDP